MELDTFESFHVRVYIFIIDNFTAVHGYLLDI